jgi:hypothetical protein
MTHDWRFNALSASAWQQSAKTLVDILILGSRPIR